MIPPDLPFGCLSCGLNYATEEALERHLNSPNYPLKCTLCNTHYRNIESFRLHLDLTHMGYMCTIGSCPYWSAEESEVWQHLKSHSDHHDRAIGSQGLTDPSRPRKFGSPAGPGFLTTSKRNKSEPDLGKDAGPEGGAHDQPQLHEWKVHMHDLNRDALQHYLGRRFPGQSFDEHQVSKSGFYWLFKAPEKQTLKLSDELDKLRLKSSAVLGEEHQSLPAKPESHGSATGYGFDPSRMVCPFRLAIPEVPSESKHPHATCRMLHKDIPSLM